MRFRLEHLDYLNPDDGDILVLQDQIVMEIKTLGGMPLWMAHALCENEIFPAEFSKYGKCYTGYIMKRPQEELSRV